MSTTASLVMVILLTAADVGPAWLWWTLWAALAAGTAAIVAGERRRDSV
ncbi:hypothetical protein [Streptomyces longhuiensis]|nr:hypothetical protein [Streptomyces longhuiensis]UDL97334.1 hypothetical protein LGI35_03180 [Streptomyces longhuiensis]